MWFLCDNEHWRAINIDFMRFMEWQVMWFPDPSAVDVVNFYKLYGCHAHAVMLYQVYGVKLYLLKVYDFFPPHFMDCWWAGLGRCWAGPRVHSELGSGVSSAPPFKTLTTAPGPAPRTLQPSSSLLHKQAGPSLLVSPCVDSDIIWGINNSFGSTKWKKWDLLR